jgi:ABC-type transporter Mla MlaB component
MAMIAAWIKIDEAQILQSLLDAGERLNNAEGEVVLDFSSVRRIDAGDLRALEDLMRKADDKSVKVGLRGVNVNIYKVFKLVKLASRFSFVN